MGAFVLPNAIIPDEAPLESFIVPGMYIDLVVAITTDLFGSGRR